MSKPTPQMRIWLDSLMHANQGDSQPMRACNCIGPRPGQPVCPCKMGSLKIVAGRYVEIIDHGPATVRSKA